MSSAVEAPLLGALQLDPDFAMAHLKLGAYYLDIAGDDAKGRPEYDTAYRLRDRVPDREKYFIASQYFSVYGNFEQSRDSLRALTAIYPDDPEFRYELAVAYYALEQLKEGISELGEAIRLNPHGARAHGSLVLFLARDNQPDAALAAFDHARLQGVDSPYLYRARGLALLAKRDFVQAQAAFEKLGAGATPYYTHLARLYQARAVAARRQSAGGHRAAARRYRRDARGWGCRARIRRARAARTGRRSRRGRGAGPSTVRRGAGSQRAIGPAGRPARLGHSRAGRWRPGDGEGNARASRAARIRQSDAAPSKLTLVPGSGDRTRRTSLPRRDPAG